jgi:TP901 family phage tail tape measure protein
MAIFIPLVTKFDSKGLDGAKRALANFQNFAVDVGRVAAAAITAVGVASVREASQFESSIAKVEGLVGVAGAELEQMAEAARRLGMETGKGAQEASDALFVIASSGLRGADAIEALELSLKASTAGLGDTESIARSVSGALNAYGTDVIDAAKATDVIVATARAGNFETSQFAGAIGRVLPFAKQAGSSLEDMGGAVALLTRTNTDAAQSVTQVAALFKAFVVPTEEAKKALDNVGLSAEDMRNAIASEGLPAALDMLDEKLGGNREQLGRLLGSSEAASAAFQILDADSQTIAETFGVVNDATGITQEAFEVMQDTAENKLAVAMATAKDSLIPIGDALLEHINPRLEDFSGWMEENKEPIEQGFIAIFTALDSIVTAIEELMGEKVLPFMKEVFEDRRFHEGMATVAGAFTVIAIESERFVDSAVGVFLQDLTKDSMLNGLGALGDRLRDIGVFLSIINDTINLLQGKEGSATFDELAQFASRLRGFSFGSNIAQGVIESLLGTGTASPDRIFSSELRGRRAGGGPVASGGAYLVGEMGPELFIPSSGGGTIVSNDRVGGGAKISITVNAGMGANGAQIGEQIVSAIKRYERTSGPVFASA